MAIKLGGSLKNKRSTGKGKPSRATGPNLEMVSDPTRRGMTWKKLREWGGDDRAARHILGVVDPTIFEKGAIKATRHMGREISPGTALPGPVPVSVWPKSQAIIIKRKTKKGVPRPESFWYNTSTPSSGPSSGQRGNISQPIDQTPPRSYKAALAQNIAYGERMKGMGLFPERDSSPQLSKARSALKSSFSSFKDFDVRSAQQIAKNKRKKKAGPPPSRGRTTINY